MIPVLMAVSFLTGAVAGWLIKRHRLALLAENNHWVGEEIEALKGADLDADVARERALRRSGETPKVQLYDQDADPVTPDHLGQPCGWSDDGVTTCGLPASTWAYWTNGEPVLLCHGHSEWMHPRVEDEDFEGPRSIPGPRLD